MQAILERNSVLTADAIARAFDSLTAPLNATNLHAQTDAELRAITKRDRKARRRHMEALSQRWGQYHSFTDLNIYAIEHLIPPDTVVEWAHKHVPDELL